MQMHKLIWNICIMLSIPDSISGMWRPEKSTSSNITLQRKSL